MTKHTADTNRRRFIKLTVTGLAAAPLANAMFSGSAEAADMVSESEPTAVALKYKMDATKAPERKDKSAFCNNCSLYTGKPGDANGPCTVFGGKLVSSKGWCASWVKKA
ncbi:MAG: High potential iron-sulfur protein [Betaproteobacteria bacterium]|nr:MAG: High potential iron-sulfur protein [Betaproteobacteria bacterium]